MSNQQYNKILIARGHLEKKSPIFSELFYDCDKKGVFIGAKDENNNVSWKRFGGFDSIILKGFIDDEKFNTMKNSYLPGDAFIVSSPVSVQQKEIIFDGEGNVRRGKNIRTYDDFFKAGQIIVYCAEDLTNIPNTAIVDPKNNYGFICVTGVQSASNVENDTKYQPIAANANDPVASAVSLNNTQSAMDYLFNNKIEYKGLTGNIDFTGVNWDTSLPTIEDIVINGIADIKKLLPGEFVVYNGDTKNIKINNDYYLLNKNTFIIKTAKVTADSKLESSVISFPLGESNSNNIDFIFNGTRSSTDAVPNVSTKDRANSDITLSNSSSESVDAQVKTVTQALDDLHQTKADLNAQGKIPLSQIPNTLVGALQYIGTVVIEEGVTSMTAVEFATAMSQVAFDSMESDSDGDFASSYFNKIDSGDYVIVNVRGTTQSESSDGTQIITKNQVKIFIDEINYFNVSEGDHVICNSVTYSGDNIVSVKLDHIDSSSSVDSINDITANVNIVGNIRTKVDTSKNESASSYETVRETLINTDTESHQIQILVPNAALIPTSLGKNYVPVGNGDKEILSSELKINGQENNSSYLVSSQLHNTELIGRTKANKNTVIEFPDESGKILAVSEQSGSENFLPKFKNRNLIDSNVSSNEENITLYDSDGNAVIIINYNDFSNLMKFIKDGSTKTLRYDETENDVKYTDHSVRLASDTNTHTILDDCSIIDCGEWS